mgnify:CR=1 FL=1
MNKRTYRIGQIVPSSNITMETEVPLMLSRAVVPNDVTFTFHSSSQSPVVYNLSNPNLQIPGCGSVDPAEIIGLDQALTRIFEE